MAIFLLRFDFRNPEFAGTTMAERYAAGLDMCALGDRLGFFSVILSEHHGADDGYLPSPLPLAAAVAARTERMRIHVSLAVAPFYDPVRLAEDASVIDNLANGRLHLTLGAGYLQHEFDLYGVPMKERTSRMLRALAALQGLNSGEPFELDGRTVRIQPPPAKPRGVRIDLGASSEPAARRAARLGVGLNPSTPDVWEFYRDELVSSGQPDPGPYLGGKTVYTHVAEDVEQGWAEILPFACHDHNSYAEWAAEAGRPSRRVETVEEVVEHGQYRVLTPDQLVEELSANPFGVCLLHPLLGGLPPEIGWQSLRLVEEKVIPRLAGQG
jgi:alkanesulfonate monooxygenase SsuD/methylene tetrahydromethanopterin reductase-like flavin-dependent oxidoreductase (luciferase family)